MNFPLFIVLIPCRFSTMHFPERMALFCLTGARTKPPDGYMHHNLAWDGALPRQYSTMGSCVFTGEHI